MRLGWKVFIPVDTGLDHGRDGARAYFGMVGPWLSLKGECA